MTAVMVIAKVGDLQPGGFMHVPSTNDGLIPDMVLFNIDGHYYAIGAACTHRGGELFEGDLDGDCIVCPIHGARFDVRTGIKEGGSRPDQNVLTYSVWVDGDNIVMNS
jgi:nitrite reductase/ring-hydroxylating ferredoxin subunit